MSRFCIALSFVVLSLSTGSSLSPSFACSQDFVFRDGERIAFVGGSLAERMNLFGNLETKIHLANPGKKLRIRNFGWPADEVGIQQRPDNYTKIDDPMAIFSPELFICFFGNNEHFAGGADQDVSDFIQKYEQWIQRQSDKFGQGDRGVRFILVSPIAFENSHDEQLPDGKKNNTRLQFYSDAISELAEKLQVPFVDLFTPAKNAFSKEAGAQFTINGIHLNEYGDRLLSNVVMQSLFPETVGQDLGSKLFDRVKESVNDKSWFHLQDYRMLNGWYVYGGRRTWDKETFPGEYQKIRKMVEVRDHYIWDLVNGNEVPAVPDDSKTGEVFVPDTMFGTRDDNFRKMREPKTLKYPTPEESIAQMKVPDGLEVQLFASEREFPELANPTQMTFDSKGRLWVSCMVNYPQWLPGSAKPGDKLLIFEDTNNDGKADVCKTFWDRLICPTGFEFYEDGVLVVDEPRIIFLKDNDGDDKADEVTHLIDGIATDDTHHAMGAWEWSHGGLLYMLEGVAMSTTMETPWGPFRNKGPSGVYVLDPKSWRFRHFKTPGYGNPWCMVFDRWGLGIVGDGTNAQQHWASPLSGYAVGPRKTLRPNFNNTGMRPAVGNEFLLSRHLPDEIQEQFVYACVINMHGIPRFEMGDETSTAGFAGKRIEDLVDSTDNFFRPIDPQIGPDGALWFGDWCNALIGHMQYSQRDPNRDHEHGRIYRLVNENKPLLDPETQYKKSIPELLRQLESYELRTRYRARRELRSRRGEAVLRAVKEWISDDSPDEQLCEALWVQESFRKIDPSLVDQILRSNDFHARSAVVHSVANEISRFPLAMDVFKNAIIDSHPRVRLEGLRGLSFVQSKEAAEVALQVLDYPMDYWLEYTLEHTLHALRPFVPDETALTNSSAQAKNHYADFLASSGPGGKAARPLRTAQNSELPKWKREQAVKTLSKISGGKAKNGKVVFERTCSACHKVKGQGKEFGPALDGVAAKYSKEQIIKHVLWPNDEIAKGYETVQVLTIEGKVINGFVLEETSDVLSLGIATDDGKGKQVDVLSDDIEERKEMKASSMPEGLVKTIAPIEFLDLVQFLVSLNKDESNWTIAGGSKDGLLTHGEFTELSRDGKIYIRDDFPGKWNEDAHLTLNPIAAKDREFAFHSPEPAIENPNVIVQLSKSHEIGHIRIQNRRNPTFYNRASGLTVWVGDDGENWNMVWQAKEVSADYSIDLTAGTRGKFIKIGLNRRGILHLNQIIVFGK